MKMPVESILSRHLPMPPIPENFAIKSFGYRADEEANYFSLPANLFYDEAILPKHRYVGVYAVSINLP
jgi:hypothetical protein